MNRRADHYKGSRLKDARTALLIVQLLRRYQVERNQAENDHHLSTSPECEKIPPHSESNFVRPQQHYQHINQTAAQLTHDKVYHQISRTQSILMEKDDQSVECTITNRTDLPKQMSVECQQWKSTVNPDIDVISKEAVVCLNVSNSDSMHHEVTLQLENSHSDSNSLGNAMIDSQRTNQQVMTTGRQQYELQVIFYLLVFEFLLGSNIYSNTCGRSTDPMCMSQAIDDGNSDQYNSYICIYI
uniref:Uncharacterized protein n=1 Tax=Heterorhabditis bacteriophora TaxID=37862 RepID=A0A1I7WH15_HETBA